MIVLGTLSQAERLEVMLWAAQNGPLTRAVRQFLDVQKMTLAAAIITKGEYGDNFLLN